MQKTYFHNTASVEEKTSKRKSSQFQYITQKRKVDINKLLNRVKLEEKNEKKNKLKIFSLASLFILIFGLLIF